MRKNSRTMAIVAAAAFILVLAVAAQQKSEDKAVDPVCGMTVTKAKAAATYEYKGTTYYFCSTGCKDAFAKDPEKYLTKAAEKVEAAPAPMAGRMTHGMPGMMPPGARMGMMPGRMGGVNALLMRRDVSWTYERTADGATLKISSKDPETVKVIQERLAQMKEMKETMAAPPAAAAAASDCPNPNCPMKDKAKK
ncbi:MAG TPA: YHS domain-containing protein [Burkholderiales bacterium]|nr:YHS domain-containing protein [Burkholderiales bacterium]